MLEELDFVSVLHKRVDRDYLGRVNDLDYPKEKSSLLAKKWDYDYWDGDRRVNYGGYRYIPGRWTRVATKIIDHYKIDEGARILDVGCGKGYQLFEFFRLIPRVEVWGLDVSGYAIEHGKEEIKDRLVLGHATELPWDTDYFDFVFSINTIHNLYNYEVVKSLSEIERVGKTKKYICVESYVTEKQKANLLYWQVTCEAFNTPNEWMWLFNLSNYTGDYSFIYFD